MSRLVLKSMLAVAVSAVLVSLAVAGGAQEPPAAAAQYAEQRYERVREDVGQACTRDPECPSPLRCELGACSEPRAIVGGATAETPMVFFYGEQGEVVYYIEVADDPLERQRGLMHRPSMLDDWGMIFVYPDERPLSFWMQNTFVALDMVFIAADGTVLGVVENAEPLTTTSRAVPGESQFVVELNAGQAAAHGIRAGVRAEFLNLPAGTITSAIDD